MDKRKAHTLLRYPGGKAKAVKHLVPLIEKTGAESLVSPFFGGGAIELALARKGWAVQGYDAWEPVVNFWKKVLQDPDRVADLVEMFRPVSNEAYAAMQKRYEDIGCRWVRAAVFFTLNRCVHTGTGLTGGKTNWGDGNPRLNDSTVEKLRRFYAPTLKLTKADFADTIAGHPRQLLYLDPPYFETKSTASLQQLYDHSADGFDHTKLAKLLNKRDNWILSYNDVEEVRDLYSRFTILKPTWYYGIKRNASNEVLILSDDLKHLEL